MVLVPKEKCFPRGGKVERSEAPRTPNPDWCKRKFSVNKKRNVKIGGTSKGKKFDQSRNETDDPTINVGATQPRLFKSMRPYSGQLTYDAIGEGMLILGSVYKIERYNLHISLPGNCVGCVPFTNISEPYRQSLSSLVNDHGSRSATYLQDMFQIGQHVVTKVVSKQIVDATTKILLTLSPQAIHFNCSNKDVVPHSVFTAAVISVEEKVYVMDLGINSVRAVLKRENAETFKKVWNRNKELAIGQLVRCKVTSVSTENHLTTVTLNANPELVAKASSSEIGSRIQGILPGMLFNVVVTRHVFPCGIQVRLSKNVVGYVPPHHLPKVFKDPQHYELGSIHPARVLYISQSEAIFFTMRKNVCLSQPPASPFTTLKAGYISKNAIVSSILDGGLIVKIEKDEDVSMKGVIPFSHLNRKEQLQNEDLELPISEQIANEFPVGTTLTCRVMDYCYMDQYYLCTMNESLMKEVYLHPSSLKVGVTVSCTVKELAPKGIVVTLGRESPVSGFVPNLHTSDMPIVHLAKRFTIGDTCTAKVLRLDGGVYLTMKQSLIQSTNLLTKYATAENGKKYLGTVVHTAPSSILVEFFGNVTGRVQGPLLSSKLIAPSDVKKMFYLGQVVNCSVIGRWDNSQVLKLSLVDTNVITEVDATKSVNADSINKGKKVTLKKKISAHGCEVSDVAKFGDVSDETTENLLPNIGGQNKNKLKTKQKLNGESLDLETSCDEIVPNKSRKKSKGTLESSEDLVVPKKKRKRMNVEDQKSEGLNSTVKKSKKMKDTCQSGMEEETEHHLSTHSKVAESEPEESLDTKNSRKSAQASHSMKETKKKRKLSTGPVDVEDCNNIVNTLKSPKNSKKTLANSFEVMDADVKLKVSSDVDPDCTQDVSSNQIEEDTKVKKKKKKRNTSCSNHIQGADVTEIKAEKNIFTSEEANEGITRITKKTKKLDTSQIFENCAQPEPIDEGYVTSDVPVAVTTNGTENKKKRKRKKRVSTGQEEEVTDKSFEQSGGAQKPVVSAADSDSAEEVETGAGKKPVELPSLSATTGFVWDVTPDVRPAVRSSGDEDSSDEESLQQNTKVKRSRQAIIAEKRLQAQLEEARLRSVEQRLMDPEQLPQTADEFDRLVLSSPDNSMVWLQYMAFHIQATEIEKARSVAQRALKTISFREEQEKLNVWVALLNLENLYGTSESVKNTLEEAIRLNDPYKVYTQMLQIYADSHKLLDGDELVAAMIKKFKTIKDMWINIATFYMKSGQLVKARALLQRALTSVEKKEHVSVISQFALLENKLGCKERAQTLMEQILTSYPKRVDVWSVYVDMLVKSNLISMARQVLERAVAQRLQSHKMKALFKKFLSFEETHGTEEDANRVRQLALEYVESATAANAE